MCTQYEMPRCEEKKKIDLFFSYLLVRGSRSTASLSEGACEGNLEGGSFTGDPGVCVKEGSRDGHFSPYGPRWVTENFER